LSFITYEIAFKGLSGRIYSGSAFSSGVYEMGITDPRERLDGATTVEEVADILADALRLIITWTDARRPEESLQLFRQRVRSVEDMDELLGLRVDCKRIVEDGAVTGEAYQLTYDFPSQTSTFSEARLSDGAVTFLGDPFVSEKGEEYNPFSRYV
jgi:hypothetical protein